MTSARQHGGCRCGRVRFAVAGAPLVVLACHCTGCQWMTGSAFSVTSIYPDDRFEVTQGEAVRGGLRAGPFHHHCGFCMSWIYTTAEQMPGFVNVRSTLLDDPALHRPYAETFRGEGLAWASTGAPVSYPGFPDPADFPTIMADYAAWDGRVPA